MGKDMVCTRAKVRGYFIAILWTDNPEFKCYYTIQNDYKGGG